jgi:flagellar protein FliO/FliZ
MELIDAPQVLKFVAALAFVLALMGGLAIVMRRINHMNPRTTPRQKRLQIVEILPLDARRRLVILRRDNREHLVILGANSETVIETGIESAQDSQDNQASDQPS